MDRQSDTTVQAQRNDSSAALRVEKANKRFDGVQALTDVSVSFVARRVTALLGENGAGKSTLIRVCSGEYLADSGQVLVSGEPVLMRSPIEATRLGIAVVHQESHLVSEKTIAENIYLARLGDRRATALHRRGALVAEARSLLRRIGLENELPGPERLCRGLSAAERQMVEFARALAGDPRVLFLDEPNSSLTRRETDRLFAIVRRLRDQEVALVFVSHRLGEAYEISDHIVVLRDGRKVGEGSPDELPRARAIELMAGERLTATIDLGATSKHTAKEPGRSKVPVLSLRGATGAAFADIDLDFHAGEIIGMAGLVGAGRTEIAKAIIGADTLLAGEVLLKGKPVRFRSPCQALRAGIAFISEERRTSMFYGQDINFNLTCTVLERFGRLGFFSGRRRSRFSRDRAEFFGVKAAGVDVPIRSLSGGNQQKVLLARALAGDPALIILDEPTRGVDVRTKAEMYRLMRRLAHEDGLAVWFISSELDEVLQLADRIVVICGGRVVDNLPRGPQAARVVASALGESIKDAATTQLVSSARPAPTEPIPGRPQPAVNTSGKEASIAMVGFGNNPYWEGVRHGAAVADSLLSSRGGSVTWIAASGDIDVPSVDKAVRAAAAKGYQGIGFFIAGETNCSTIRALTDSGVAIGVYNTLIDGVKDAGAVVDYAQEHIEAGRNAARELIKAVGENAGRVGIIVSQFTAPGSEQRRKGFIEGLQGSKITPVSEGTEAKDSAGATFNAAKNYLTSTSDLVGVYCTAGGPFGAAQAVKAAGRQDTVKVIAFDFTLENIAAIRDGSMYGVTGQDEFGQGYNVAILLFNAVVAGERPAQVLQPAPSPFMTKDNVDQLDPSRLPIGAVPPTEERTLSS